MAYNLNNDYPALISNQVNTNPQETALRKSLMNAYLKQLQGQSLVAPIAQAVDFLGGSYRGGKNAPVGTLTALSKNPTMSQIGNVMGWMGRQSTGINPLQLARFQKSEEKDAYRKEQTKLKNRNDFFETYEKDKLVRDSREKIDAIAPVRALLAENTPISAPVIQRMILKLTGDFRFSDQDVKAFQGSKAALDRLEQTMQTIGKGNYSEANRQDLVRIVQVLERGAYAGLRKRQKRFIDAAELAYNIDKDTAKLMIGYISPEEKSKKKKTVQRSKTKLTDDQVREMLRNK